MTQGRSRDIEGSTGPAAAEIGSLSSGRSYAVVIGIDRYDHGIPRLETAVADASAMARLLGDLHGYDVLCRPDGEATLAGLRALLGSLVGKLGPGDRVLFYFAGHGVAKDADDGDGPQGYLIPQDAHRDDVATFLPMAEVQA